MNILVTGGAGYIGSKVSFDLLDKGHNVVIIDNLSNSYKKNVPKKSKFYKLDINEKKKIEKLIIKFKIEAVYHFAAHISVEESLKFPKKYFNNNYLKTKKFINLCTKNNIKHFIFSSTASVYGKNLKKVSENSKILPNNPYGISKMKVENYIKRNLSNTNFCILRYFNVAGADKKLRTGQNSRNKATHLIKKLTEAIQNKKLFFNIYGNNYNTKDGTAVRDFIHIEDLSNIHIKILNYMKKNINKKITIFNCGYGDGFSVYEIIKIAKKIYNFNYKFSKRRKGDAPYVVANNLKIKKELKWKEKYKSIFKIIDSALKWEKKLKKIRY